MIAFNKMSNFLKSLFFIISIIFISTNIAKSQDEITSENDLRMQKMQKRKNKVELKNSS